LKLATLFLISSRSEPPDLALGGKATGSTIWGRGARGKRYPAACLAASSGSPLSRNIHLAAAETALIKALSLAPQYARAHRDLRHVKIVTNRAAQGIADCERALELNRNLAEAHGSIGWAKILLGRAAEAEGHVLEGLRLSPRDSGIFRWLHCVGVAKLMLGADVEAVVWLRKSLEANRNYPLVHFHLSAALVFLQEPDEARAAVREGVTLDPTFAIRRMRRLSDHPTFRAQSARIRDGMRLAGVPEG
jgi:tetratricopeptide (TPR) repeat protein